jgi:RNA polymerase primary sigma factor
MNTYDIPAPLQAYLREIGETALLTREQEVKLARRIRRGDKAAKDLMVRANLRLVVKIANDYSHYGLPILDLISEGNIGLMKAVDRFDPRKGAKFSTYAAWWIKQSIRRALANQSKTIRLPVHLVDKIQKMRRISHQLTDELGREPTDEELASELGMSATKVRSLRSAGIQPLSLDATIGTDNDEATLGEIIGDENTQSPVDQLMENDLQKTMFTTLHVLDERELRIIALRFGLDGNKEHTLEEVGKRFKVTRERIRQLQNIALNKLKKNILQKDQWNPKASLEENSPYPAPVDHEEFSEDLPASGLAN